MRSERFAILSAVLLVVGCSGDDAADEKKASTSVAAVTSTTELTVELARGREVVAEGTSFDPPTLTVVVGERVGFTNYGGSHSVTPEDPEGWDGGGLPLELFGEAGRAYSTSFAEPGEYAYYCEVHGGKGGKGMSGVIVVE